MKWKNVDTGAGYYYITGTLTEWLPLFRRLDVRGILCDSIKAAVDDCGVSIAAFVVMPDHVHLLVYLPDGGVLHRFCKIWRGRSGRRIARVMRGGEDERVLSVLRAHARGRSEFAVWKEQVRALPIHSARKLRDVIHYIHANPVRRQLVDDAGAWPFSSFRFYESGERPIMEVTPPRV